MTSSDLCHQHRNPHRPPHRKNAAGRVFLFVSPAIVLDDRSTVAASHSFYFTAIEPKWIRAIDYERSPPLLEEFRFPE
ncbi:MAG TPA: hypothetical protein VGF88_16540 [Acidobacteriaceae bacterium]